MFLKQLSLTNFRNYHSLKINISSSRNIFFGDNGEGKTNLLEAIYYASLFKSFRTSNTQDLIRNQQDFFTIDTVFTKDEIEHKLHISYNNQKKEVLLDEKKIKKKNSFYQMFPVLLFSNLDMNLGSGAPFLRRQFFDQLLSSISNNYLVNCIKYNKVLLNRNKCLKHNADYKKWDEQLIRYGTYLISARLKFINIIINKFKTTFKVLSDKEDFIADIKYQIKTISVQPVDINQDILKLFQAELIKNRENDEQYMATSFGPHKDDFNFFLNNIPVKHSASQGQLRLFVYALKFTIYEYLHTILKEYPVLLLDDIFSDLDCFKIKLLFEYIKKSSQLFISCPNYSIISDYLKEFNIYRIENGQVQ